MRTSAWVGLIAAVLFAFSLAQPSRASIQQMSDIACEISATTGTGTLNLGGAAPGGYLGFAAAGIDSGSTIPYRIVTGSGASRKIETGWGLFTDATPDTLTRDADWSSDGQGAELNITDSVTVCIGPITSQRVGELIPVLGPELPLNCIYPEGTAVSRTTYARLFDAITVKLTATRTSGNATLSSTSKDLRNLGLEGARIEGTGIPSSTTVSSVTATTIVMSANASSGSATLTDVRIFPWGNGDQSTTFGIPDLRGRALFGRDNMGGTSANRLTGLTNGVNGDVLANTGGLESVTIAQANLPNVSFTGTSGNASVDHTHTVTTGTESQSHTHTGTSGTESQSHTHSTTTGTESAGHTHSGTSGGRSAAHTHSTTTGGISANHTHSYTVQSGTQNLADTGSGSVLPDSTTASSNTGTVSSDHTHSGTSGTESADHTHSTTTGGASVTHTHTGTSGNTSVTHTHSTTTGNASVTHTHSATSAGQSATHTHSESVSSGGSGTAANVLPPAAIVNVCIVTGIP